LLAVGEAHLLFLLQEQELSGTPRPVQCQPSLKRSALLATCRRKGCVARLPRHGPQESPLLPPAPQGAVGFKGKCEALLFPKGMKDGE
jgi:hypothetical protein